VKTVHFEQVYLGAKIEDFGLLKNDHNQLSKASEIIQKKKLQKVEILMKYFRITQW